MRDREPTHISQATFAVSGFVYSVPVGRDLNTERCKELVKEILRAAV